MSEPSSDPDSIGGLGDQPSYPITTLPPVQEVVGDHPLSPRTGEPARPPVIRAITWLFGVSSVIAFASYWWYWFVAITITDFQRSSLLIQFFEPRPGSGSSVVLACVMAVLGAITTAGPAMAAYNVWHGASWSRTAVIAGFVTSLLTILVMCPVHVAFPIATAVSPVAAAIAAALLWTPGAKGFLTAWDAYANPPRPPIVPPAHVGYGPAPRFQ